MSGKNWQLQEGDPFAASPDTQQEKTMVLTEEQRLAFAEAAKPLMKFLADNFHPHTMAIVDATSAELFEGVATYDTPEFIKD